MAAIGQIIERVLDLLPGIILRKPDEDTVDATEQPLYSIKDHDTHIERCGQNACEIQYSDDYTIRVEGDDYWWFVFEVYFKYDTTMEIRTDSGLYRYVYDYKAGDTLRIRWFPGRTGYDEYEQIGPR